jgi:tight adherence protein C
MTYSIGFILLLIGMIVLFLGFRTTASESITERLYIYLGGMDPQDMESSLSKRHRRPPVSGSFRNRILLPAFQSITRFLGRLTPGRLSANMERQLAIAGNPLGLGPKEFYVLRLGFTAIGFTLAFLLINSGLYSSSAAAGGIGIPVTGSPFANPEVVERPISLTGVLISIFVLIIVSNLPKTWLRRKVRIRTNAIRKSLPDALDMLSVCADAGLGFDQSLQRVSTSWDNTLAKEFGRVVTEMGMGLSRKTALRNLADRTDVPELSSFVAVILQSDQLGMSITQTLHAQAKQMRIERRFRAQEQARKMPLKMLFPLLLLIFPAMFAVILGPMVPVLGQLFTTIRSSTF